MGEGLGIAVCNLTNNEYVRLSKEDENHQELLARGDYDTLIASYRKTIRPHLRPEFEEQFSRKRLLQVMQGDEKEVRERYIRCKEGRYEKQIIFRANVIPNCYDNDLWILFLCKKEAIKSIQPRQKFYDAVQQLCLKTYELNLNTEELLEYVMEDKDIELEAVEKGWNDLLEEHMQKYIEPAYKEKVWQEINLDKLKAAYSHDQEYLSISYPRKAEDGTYQWVNTWIHIYSTENGDPCCMIYVQRMEEKTREYEQQINRLKKEKEQADNSSNEKTELLKNISYGVRIPMNAIIGMATLAKASLDKPEEVAHYLDKLKDASDELMTVVNSLLQMPQQGSENNKPVHRLPEEHSGNRLHVKAATLEEDKDKAIFQGKRVLVVDDMPINVEIIYGFLKGTGVHLEKAYLGQEAVSAVLQKRNGYYDAILLDMKLPDISGFEVAREIRLLSEQGSVPIISISGSELSREKRKAEKLGIMDAVLKPINKEELIQVLKKYLL